MTSKKIVAVSGGVLVPSTRYRVKPILSGLKNLGWDSKSIYGYGEWDHQIKNRRLQYIYRSACRIKRAFRTAAVRHDGPILLQRLAIPFSGLAEAVLLRRNRRVVFDFDDAIYLDTRHQVCDKRTTLLQAVFSKCNHVIAGNQFLATHVGNLAPVTVIPTCIDTDIYSSASKVSEGPPVVGWMGTAGNFANLKQLIAPLADLRRRHRFKLVICSDREDAELFQDLGAEFVRWSPAKEVAILQSFDIGLMPLDDNAWTRGKCSFKLIQYMAVGRAAVASPVGMNNDVIDGHSTGLFAEKSDWYSPLDALLSDRAKRKKIGHSARVRVVENYSVQSALPKYDRVFSSLK